MATGSIAEACDGAEAVISIVPEGDHVRAVYLDEGGVLDSAAPDTLLIDMSTIDLATVHAVQGAARERGFEMLDAPVSRGTKGAREGTLVIIAGAHGRRLRAGRDRTSTCSAPTSFTPALPAPDAPRRSVTT